jgi:hypothetical protein
MKVAAGSTSYTALFSIAIGNHALRHCALTTSSLRLPPGMIPASKDGRSARTAAANGREATAGRSWQRVHVLAI